MVCLWSGFDVSPRMVLNILISARCFKVIMTNLNFGASLVLVGLLLGFQAAITATAAAEFNYGKALDKTFMFFEAQRSDKLSSDQRVKWRGYSALKDGSPQNVDLVGGYYDAGDHVKFGSPMAFSVTMLAWGTIDYRKEITNLNQMGHALWAIRWDTNYFKKAHTQSNVLWGQVMGTLITFVGSELKT